MTSALRQWVLLTGCSLTFVIAAGCHTGSVAAEPDRAPSPSREAFAAQEPPAARDDDVSQELNDLAREDALSTRVQPPAPQTPVRRPAPEPVRDVDRGPADPPIVR